jgi:hypothetical protein
MAIDYSQLANVVQAELRQFLCTVQQTDDESVHQTATERLWSMITGVEDFACAPSGAQWHALCEAQRWGYLRLESYVGMALHELHQRQRTVLRARHSPLLNGGTHGESLPV